MNTNTTGSTAITLKEKTSAPVRRSARIQARIDATSAAGVHSGNDANTGMRARRSARIQARTDSVSMSADCSGKEELTNACSSAKTGSTVMTSSSSIGQHLIANATCAMEYDDSRFSIIAYARDFNHLKVLEAIYITKMKPILCKQKKFVSHSGFTTCLIVNVALCAQEAKNGTKLIISGYD